MDNDHGTLKGAGGISETLHSKFIEIYAVASDITVELSDALGVWEWTPSAKATVAKGKTQKFELKPSVKLNTKMDGGWRTWIGTVASRYNTYDSILKIKVSSEGKTTEEKDFLTRVYNYRL